MLIGRAVNVGGPLAEPVLDFDLPHVAAEPRLDALLQPCLALRRLHRVFSPLGDLRRVDFAKMPEKVRVELLEEEGDTQDRVAFEEMGRAVQRISLVSAVEIDLGLP